MWDIFLNNFDFLSFSIYAFFMITISIYYFKRLKEQEKKHWNEKVWIRDFLSRQIDDQLQRNIELILINNSLRKENEELKGKQR